MRGSTPLDVAASSVMDNNSLALALEEPDLEKVTDQHQYNIISSHMTVLKLGFFKITWNLYRWLPCKEKKNSLGILNKLLMVY